MPDQAFPAGVCDPAGQAGCRKNAFASTAEEARPVASLAKAEKNSLQSNPKLGLGELPHLADRRLHMLAGTDLRERHGAKCGGRDSGSTHPRGDAPASWLSSYWRGPSRAARWPALHSHARPAFSAGNRIGVGNVFAQRLGPSDKGSCEVELSHEAKSHPDEVHGEGVRPRRLRLNRDAHDCLKHRNRNARVSQEAACVKDCRCRGKPLQTSNGQEAHGLSSRFDRFRKLSAQDKGVELRETQETAMGVARLASEPPIHEPQCRFDATAVVGRLRGSDQPASRTPRLPALLEVVRDGQRIFLPRASATRLRGMSRDPVDR